MEKRRKAQKHEAKELVIEYYKTYGKKPAKHILSEFFWLFEKRDSELDGSFKWQMSNMNNYNYSINQFQNSTPEFDGYEAFLEYCFKAE